MSNIEIVDVIDKGKQGRPMNERTQELYDAMNRAKRAEKYGLKVELQDDEREKFYRFTQRCRSAAKQAGLRVSISKSRNGVNGNIRILMD